MWEYKFVFKDDRVADAIFGILSKIDCFDGYPCKMKDEIVNTDYYFDSPDLSLESKGMVCRIRQTNNEKRYELALKRQVLGPNREVVYTQTTPMPLGKDTLENALHGHFPDTISEILRIFTDSERIENVLTVKVARTIISLYHPHTYDEIASLNLDRTEAFLTDKSKTLNSGYEIELKSFRKLFPEADMLRDYLRNTFNLIPVTRSKLRRLSPFIRQKKRGDAPQKVILDMDTGVDDALALILAMNSPELEVLGITTVSGNVDAGQSARNTAAVLGKIRKCISARYPKLLPIASGGPPETDLPDASDVHGHDGLGGVCEKHIDTSIAKDIEPEALELFKKILRENEPGTITLVTTGPLTNLAHWIEKAPDVVKRLRGIVSMGGVFFQCGNRSQAAEFNVHANSTAARKVVEFCRKPVSRSHHEWHETLPLTFIGLDVTHEVRFYRDVLEKSLKKASNKSHLRFIKEITGHYMNFYYRNEGLDGCYLHDPLVVGYVIDPSLCQVEQYHVEIEDKGEFTSGMTVADYRPTRIFKDKMKEVTWVCYKVDAERFEKMFHERVLSLW